MPQAEKPPASLSRSALPERRRHRRRRKTKALLSGGLVFGMGAAATLAAWTDEENASGQFQAGSFAIEANTDGNVDGEWSAERTLQFDAAGIFPGSTVYAPALVRTTPDTTADAQLTLSGLPDASTELTNALQQRAVVRLVAPGGTPPSCDSSALTEGADYVVGSATEYASMGSASTAPTSQTAESGGTMWVQYCFEVTLPTDASNDVQGVSGDYTWTWNAESIAADS